MKKIIIFFLLAASTSCMLQGQTLYNEKIIGYWSWAYSPHIGMTEGEKIIFHVFEKDGKLTGESFSLKNGKRKELSHLAIQEVKQENGEFVLVLPWANHYYKGTLSADGNTLNGFVKHHSEKDDLKLTRVDHDFASH